MDTIIIITIIIILSLMYVNYLLDTKSGRASSTNIYNIVSLWEHVFFSHLKRSCRRWYYYYLIWSKLISCRSLTFHRLAWSFFLNPLLMHLMTIWDNYFPFFFWCSPMAFRILRHIALWPLLVMYAYYYGPILMIATVILFHH